MSQPAEHAERKPEVEQIELARHDSNQSMKKVDEFIQLKSEQDELGILQTAWRFRKCVFTCTLLCLAAAADGYQINLNGAVIANSGFARLMGTTDDKGKYVINANHNALWGALQSLGQMIAMVGMNPISDRIGRKWTLYTLWMVLCSSLLLESFVQDWRMWAVAKLLAGLGVGAVQSTLPVYISEWSPVNIRGAMILAYGIWNNFGNFMAPVVLSISEKRDKFDYKTPILTQWVFLGLMLPIFLYLPETPAYFAARGQHERGLKSLRRVNGKVKGYNIEQEYAVIVNTIEEERKSKELLGLEVTGFRAIARSYVACFQGPNLLRTFGASLPAVCQQTNALSLLNTYGALFFKQAGYTNAFTVKAILTSLKIVGVLITFILADRFGRRFMVLICSWAAWSMLIVVAASGAHTSNPAIAKLAVAGACLWAVPSGALGAIGWTFCGEVASQRLRARTSGLAAAIAVIFGLTFNTSVPIMIDVRGANLGFKAVWIFVGFGGVANVFALFFAPEPARRSPAELDELFEKRIPAWRMKGYVTDVELSAKAGREAHARVVDYA